MRGRVYCSSQREFYCKLDETQEIIVATALGKLLKGRDNQIVVGDYVRLEKNSDDKGYKIVEVEKRYGEVFRVIVREALKKITAANIDLLIIISSVSSPVYKRGIIDRFLVRSYQWNIKPLIVFNKMDQHNPDDCDIYFESDRLRGLGIESFEVSAIDRTYEPKFLSLGISHLREMLRGKTALVLGQSGVGKSELINCLAQREIALPTGHVGKQGKGTHTTTWSEIIEVDDFFIVDSPGIRSLSLEDLASDDFMSYFPDLADIAVQCQYVNCDHSAKSRGCAFHNLDPESYETKLLFSRLESYQRIYGELSEIPHWANRIAKKDS